MKSLPYVRDKGEIVGDVKGPASWGACRRLRRVRGRCACAGASWRVASRRSTHPRRLQSGSARCRAHTERRHGTLRVDVCTWAHRVVPHPNTRRGALRREAPLDEPMLVRCRGRRSCCRREHPTVRVSSLKDVGSEGSSVGAGIACARGRAGCGTRDVCAVGCCPSRVPVESMPGRYQSGSGRAPVARDRCRARRLGPQCQTVV